MLVVHALWSPGRGVLLWAEDGERPATGRSRALRTARPHPFAAPADALAALHPGTPTQVTMLLPAHAGGPLPSPELVRSARAATPRGEPELRPWALPAVAVDAAELDDPADELRYGASVAHLRAVAANQSDFVKFSCGIVASPVGVFLLCLLCSLTRFSGTVRLGRSGNG